MYNLCSQHLQSLNSVQQKLFVLQLFKDLFQICPPALKADFDSPGKVPNDPPALLARLPWCQGWFGGCAHTPRPWGNSTEVWGVQVWWVRWPRQIEVCLQRWGGGASGIWNISLSGCRAKSFCCTELIFCRCWLHRLYIIHENFCFKLNNISGVLILFVSSVLFFLYHPVWCVKSFWNTSVFFSSWICSLENCRFLDLFFYLIFVF